MRCHAEAIGPLSIEIVEAAGFLLLGHTHDTPHLLIVLDGHLAEDGQCLRRGDARFSPGGDEHFVRGLGRARMLLVLGDALLPAAIDARATMPAPAVAPLGERLASTCLRQGASREIVAATLGELLDDAAALWARSQDRLAPSWLLELRRRVAFESDAACRVVELARRAGVSREHLARSFRAWYGTPISAFLRDRRLARAWRGLVTTDWPLAEVAFESGFADQSHLTRQMHAAYGLTPAALRRRSRPGITFVQDGLLPAGDASC